MRKPVVFVRVLVAMKIFTWFAIGNAMPLAQGFVITFQRIGLNKLRPMRLNSELAFFAGISRDDNLNRYIHHRSKHRVRDAGITRARIQYNLSLPDLSLNQSLEKHPPNRPIF